MLFKGDILREKFIEELIKEVHGPRGGCEEILEENPLIEYLSGVLIPKQELSELIDNPSPESEQIRDNDSFDVEDDTLDEAIDISFPSELDPKLRTRSFGISFVIEGESPSIDVCITWARYFSNGNEEVEKWQRKPFYQIKEDIGIYEGNQEFILEGKKNDSINLFIKTTYLEENKYNVMVSLVNSFKNPDKKLDVEKIIFQPSLRINLNGTLPDIFPKNIVEDKLEFIYRNRSIKAKGHMCSALWNEIDYMNQFDLDLLWPDGNFFKEENSSIEEYIEPMIRTEFVPLYPMPLPSFDVFDNSEDYDSEHFLDAERLSEIWNNEDIDRELMPLVSEYSKWIEAQELEQKNLDSIYGDISKEIIENQRTALTRIKEGIEILKSNLDAKLAFCFANKVILIQHQWKKPKAPFNWRAFQIAFFLMNIESIIEEKSKYRQVLDLLWIATGGGKTESYLAIMAFTFVYRRLSNENYAGTSIFSRYTLRLLTVQQFSRTLSLITAAEYLRVYNKQGFIGWRPKKCDIKKDWLYGSLRFSLGMWVGSAVTPNSLLIKDKNDEFAALKILTNSSSKRNSSNPAQVVKCPVCGAWLSIPETGIPEGEPLFIVIESSNKNFNELCNDLKKIKFVEDVDYYDENHKDGYCTLKFVFNQHLTDELLDELNLELSNVKVSSLSISNPGYFGSFKSEGKNNENYSDYNIFCTDPDCELNKEIFWKEGHPFQENEKLDIYWERIIDSPFNDSSRIPIPAYTVDDHIYSKCPTIIIGTADKIARMPYEGRIATMFGNVTEYNKYYGFLKNGKSESLPKKTYSKNLDSSVTVDKFLPPDLIIQDELHLIDGPLGSLFGIYEAILNAIIKENGGNPKYIASSATIKNAELQSKLLFAKELYQFPPHGLDMEDNFFVKENPLNDAWDENKRGRVYMGIYAPGRGPMTPQVRLWSSMLNTSLHNESEENILYYWTIVGYFNAIRELGGAIALYREDISERIKNLSGLIFDSSNNLELSSRLSSTKIPLELAKIEDDGNNKEKDEHPNLNAIFSTSMFGTGVDISHLSLMIMNGQPKATGSYIQASGRIGREHGGLIVTFLKAGRPRDLSHYEMFPAYHHKIQTDVEPISVSPFSKGALDKAIGATIVSFFRNSKDMEFDWDQLPIPKLDDSASEDFDKLKKDLKERLSFIFDNDGIVNESAVNEIIENFEESFKYWKNESNSENDYYYKDSKWKRRNVVLGEMYHEHQKDHDLDGNYHYRIYKKTPQSLREVEETTMFWV